MQVWPWEDQSLSELDMAFRRMRAMFEFLGKLGVDFWCFHDRCVPTPRSGSALAQPELMVMAREP